MTKVEATHKLLSAKIHNKVVGVIELEDGRRQSIQHMNQIWDNNQWVLFSPESSEQQVQPNLLIWDESNVSLLDVVGGQNSKVHFRYRSINLTRSNQASLCRPTVEPVDPQPTVRRASDV